MSKAEVECGYADAWNSYNNGIIGWNVLKDQVEYYAVCMKRYDADRARQMRSSVA